MDLLRYLEAASALTPESERDQVGTDWFSGLCDKLAQDRKTMARMSAWYVFEDKRDGTVVERFERDAKSFYEISRLFQV